MVTYCDTIQAFHVNCLKAFLYFPEFVINGTLDRWIRLKRGSIEVNEHGCCPWRQNHISSCFSEVFAESGDSIGIEEKGQQVVTCSRRLCMEYCTGENGP